MSGEVCDHLLCIREETAAGGVGGDDQDRTQVVLVGPLDFMDDEMAVVRRVPEEEGGWRVDGEGTADEGAALVLVPEMTVDRAVMPVLIDVWGEIRRDYF